MRTRATTIRALIASCALLSAIPAVAGPHGDALGTCLADNTSGKERKNLARWIFSAMATHPEMKDLSNATAQTRDKISQSMGVLVTRLLTENCAVQTRAAVQNEGNASLEAAFGSLGALAMQELMSNQDVNAAIGQFERYVDSKKIQASMTAN